MCKELNHLKNGTRTQVENIGRKLVETVNAFPSLRVREFTIDDPRPSTFAVGFSISHDSEGRRGLALLGAVLVASEFPRVSLLSLGGFDNPDGEGSGPFFWLTVDKDHPDFFARVLEEIRRHSCWDEDGGRWRLIDSPSDERGY